MTKPLYIFTPCGTSVLTNTASSQQKKVIFPNSNARTRQDVSPKDRVILDNLLKTAARELLAADAQQAAAISAELNSLTRIMNQAEQPAGGFHQLLCTDTWLGEETGKLVQQWLEQQGYVVQLKRQKDLQTKDPESFQLALADLVSWFEEEMDSWREKYRIVFNLTGGFKSVQGFLQTLASFYADETVYIFETGNDLIRIPRLPIEMATLEVVTDNLAFFRCIDLGIPVSLPDDIPEILLLKIDDEVALSPWGELIWKQNKRKLYCNEVYPSPLDTVRFGNRFLKSVARLDSDRTRQINQKIDDLCRFWLKKGTADTWNPRSLDFKELQGKPMLPLTHECDAWADQDAQRIFMHIEKDNVLVLDRLETGLH